ncbi:MAG: MiaB/RimO family radical SAM methylthiotransferase [Actinomycetota bacterium]|nr:MiaB/RimO family radical SAM methylthiotransferase [Actinomycetota bacterium]
MTQEAPRQFLIRTFGCQMNEHDSERLTAMLEADGLEATDDLAAADIVVLNTCCIRENADNRLYGQLGQLKSLKAERPGMQIAVGGCLAQKDGALVQSRAPQVDAVFGTHNLAAAPRLLRQAAAEGPVMEILDAAQAGDEADFPSALATHRNLAYAAWVTIQVGCDNACAFCIVPAVRGPEVSRPFGRLVAEVEGLAGAGTTEVTLLGQNVNSYGRDITLGLRAAPGASAGDLAGDRWASSAGHRARPLFADLLRAVGAVDGIRRVRFTSPHPKDLRPDTIEAMAETPEVCEHLHLPLQSGSNRTLAAMHRGYTAERYLARLAEARAAVPDLAVTTDIIVGFPGETDDDFERTLTVASEVGYDSAYTFLFSPRPGTTAADLPDQFVAPEVAAERFERLRVVVERSALARHQARVGRVEEVLVEGPSKRNAAVTTGRTRQNKLVHFPVPDGAAPGPGSYATVRVTGAAPHYLRGELIEITARARHRTLIPVAAS